MFVAIAMAMVARGGGLSVDTNRHPLNLPIYTTQKVSRQHDAIATIVCTIEAFR